MASAFPEFMNTRQAARYLRINEKKVYALAKAGKIPCTRATGKWTFPRRLIDAWIERSAVGAERRSPRTEPRRFLLAAGSDDPSLAVLRELFEQRSQPSVFFVAAVGSSGGLKALRDGIVDFATTHLWDASSGEYNLPFVKDFVGELAVVVQLFYRDLGLVVAPGNPKKLRSIADLGRPKLRLVNRQEGSGTRLYLDHELARLKIDAPGLHGYEYSVSTHAEVGMRVLRGEADVGLATLAAARMLGLDFVPLTRERFDGVILQENFFSPAIQTLLSIIGSAEFRSRLDAMGGYDGTESGRIVYAN